MYLICEMYEWLQLRLKEHTGVRIAQRRAWWATLQWYFGYCAKKGLGEPFERENSHIFLRELLRSNPRTQGDSTQREAALNWFFSEVVATDSAGQRMRRALRREHVAASTEKAYMGCLRRFQAFVHPRDAMQVDAAEALQFLSHLAAATPTSTSTQNQAYNALCFFFRHVLQQAVPERAAQARRAVDRKLPTILSKSQVYQLLECLPTRFRLMGRLHYGTGLRLNELLRLRIRDVDVDRGRLVVRGCRGAVARTTVLPQALVDSLQLQLQQVRAVHQADLAKQYAGAAMPAALARKYAAARTEWSWQYLFPHSKLTEDPPSGARYRPHVLENSYQQAVRSAANKAAIAKRVTPQVFRHSFAVHLLEAGAALDTVQALLGHPSRQATQIYTQLLQKPFGIVSPLDTLTPSYA
jgi:integron integrase